jgi:hypothetical protein
VCIATTSGTCFFPSTDAHDDDNGGDSDDDDDDDVGFEKNLI